MKRFFCMCLTLLFLGAITAAHADDAEFRTIVTQNDKTIGGEYRVDLQFRLVNASGVRTLSSLRCDLAYGEGLAAWLEEPDVKWAFGEVEGYLNSVMKNAGVYQVQVDGAMINAENAINCPGEKTGWNATEFWQSIVTLRWTIKDTQAISVTMTEETAAASYFLNLANCPSSGVLDFVLLNMREQTNLALACEASFEASADPATVGETITFTCNTPDVVSYSWDFGDGSTASGNPVTHVYTATGTVTVNMTILCQDNTSDTDTDILTVNPPPPCVASFNFNPASPVVGETVTFINTSSGDLSLLWNFGDGFTSAGNIASHVYTSAGTFNVTLSITCYAGGNVSAPVPIVVNPAPSCFASFIISPDPPIAGQAVQFLDQGSLGALAWSWDFGDGASDTGYPMSHVYANPGTYNATLTIRCAGGVRITDTDIINVVGPPSCIAEFTAAPNPVVVGESVTFASTSTNVLSYDWDFGDGSTANGNPVTHVYTIAGSYPAVLTITCTAGTDVSDPTTITVTEIPTCNAAISLSAETACINRPITFTGNEDANSWTWDFGDGETASGRIVTHAYISSSDSPYLITLTTSCEGNVSATATHSLPSGAPPTADFVASPLSGEAPLTVSFTNLSSINATSWVWDFGDGEESMLQNPTHTFNVAQIYDISLTAINDCGGQTETKTGYITVRPVIADRYDYGHIELPSARALFNANVSIGNVITAEITPADDSEMDGIILDDLIPGQTASIGVTVTQNGFISAWIDFDGNTTDWGTTPPTNIITPQAINGGVETSFNFQIPVTAQMADQRWLRLRYSVGSLSDVAAPQGYADTHYGEVQDYLLTVTPVELSSFAAECLKGTVRLEWRTQSETENLGFHVFRSTNAKDGYQQITTNMITGAGTSSSIHDYLFEDRNITANQTYYYKLADVDFRGRMQLHGPIMITASAPSEYTLAQNYPNPFNPETTISFSLKETGYVNLTIYNMNGQIIRTLAAKQYNAGMHSCNWDGRDNNGKTVPSGVYLYKIKVNGYEISRKMEFVK